MLIKATELLTELRPGHRAFQKQVARRIESLVSCRWGRSQPRKLLGTLACFFIRVVCPSGNFRSVLSKNPRALNPN